jgi:hypothetical protein
MTRPTSKLLSMRLRQSSGTGYVSLNNIAKTMLIPNRRPKKRMQTTKKKMWMPWKHVRDLSR